ncbi:MAG TPA: type II toxin-antitoxin system Phd/YefM family antitoxin [Vicinamibacteria bacterium]|nr:type II toxin-antitoxin system Phd/YefM family antitoxin [Vicinamibacteria bacterium]
MEDVSTREARKNLADLVNRVAYGNERFIVTRHGKGVAALVPLSDVSLLERLRRLLSRREVKTALEKARTVSWAELKKDLEL